MIDSTLPIKIQRIYNSVSEDERIILKQILQELSMYGESQTYRDIWLADYKEIPVDIDTFIEHDDYLGRTNRNGAAVYPFWRKTLHEIFDAGNQYEEIFLTGATRIGKSSTAITGTAYMLYRLMCLRDPQEYFGKKEVSKFSILFFNITKDLASGVAFREFNDTLKASPWFNRHGTFSKSERNFYYIPEGGKVVVDFGSDAAHGLGQQVYCLMGDTQILTSDGYVKLSQLVDQSFDVGQYCDDGVIYTPATVQCTKYVTETVRITLEDGSIIEGTPDHKVMLSDGSYKELSEITNSDDLITFNIDEVDQMNLNDYETKFTVYRHISPSGKQYVGITSKPVHIRWGKGGKEYKSNKHFWAAICKYGWDNFVHEIIATDISLDDACSIECGLIDRYNLTDPMFGYNKTSGGQYSSPNSEVRDKLRESSKKLWADPKFRSAVTSKLTGRALDESVRQKISESKLGQKYNKPSPLKGRKLSESRVRKLRGKSPWNKGLNKHTSENIARGALKLSGRHKTSAHKQALSESHKRLHENYVPMWITDGTVETLIDSTFDIPEGFTKGRLGSFKYVHRLDECKRVPVSDVDQYLNQGWELGRGRVEGIQKAAQKFVWILDGVEYSTAENVAQVLRQTEYPNIVSSTITALYNKGFEQSRRYSGLAGRLTRRSIDEG